MSGTLLVMISAADYLSAAASKDLDGHLPFVQFNQIHKEEQGMLQGYSFSHPVYQRMFKTSALFKTIIYYPIVGPVIGYSVKVISAICSLARN